MGTTQTISASSSSTRRQVLDAVMWCISLGLIFTAVALAF